MTSMHLREVAFYRGREYGDGDVVWIDHSDDMPLPSPGGHGELATLLINVGVDGMFTIVHHQGGDRVILAKVIDDLSYLLERLDAMYPDDEPRGRCMVFGDWGRCCAMEGEPHDFPTEADWNRTRAFLRAVGS